MSKPLYFIFNNINSLDVKQLNIINTLPQPNSPSRRVTKVNVVGRSGELRIQETDEYGSDVFDSIEKPITVCYTGNDYDLIKKWLRGTSNLILSNQPDRYFRASIDNIIPIEQVSRRMRNFTITFSCYPYTFLTQGDKSLIFKPMTADWSTIIMNEYELSLPHIKIFGHGDIGIKVNGVETDFYFVDQYIECDSDMQQCYKDKQNMGMNMSGQFPVLYPGKNVIEFTGNIQEVQLTPHWRTL